MKRFFVVTACVLGVIVALGVVGFFGLGFYLSPQSPLAKADVIVAISGGDTDARTTAAVELYQQGWAPKIVFSGAALDSNSPSNARVMASAAEARGVPTSAISLDEAATNTRENAANVKSLLGSTTRTIILVTSPYHQRRANIVFQRSLGSAVTILNHSSLDQGWRRSDWWATSTSRSLTLSELQKVIYELASRNQ